MTAPRLDHAPAKPSRALLPLFAGACLIALLGGVFAQEQRLHAGLLVDDAYITLRHAANLVQGHGLNYNPGERVEGYTSFAHAALIALVIALDLDPVGWAKGLGVAASVALLVVGFQLWRKLLGTIAAVGLTAALALDPRLAAMSTWGLEATLYMAVLTAAWLASVERRLVLAGLLFGVAALTRMEALLQVAVAALAAGLLGSGEPAAAPLAARERLRRAARLGLPCVMLYGPYYLARYAYYGFPLPNTFYAKVGNPADAYQRGISYLADCTRNMGIGWALASAALLALPAIVLGLRRRTGVRVDRLAVAVAAAAHLGYVVAVGGDLFVERFVYHVLPLLLATVVWPVVALAEQLSSRAVRNSITGAFVAAVALTLARSPDRMGSTGMVVGFAALGRALALLVPADSTLATGAAGALPYYSRLYTIDTLGLCNVHIAHRDVPIGKGLVGHERHDPAYVLARKPDYIAAWIDRQGLPSGEYPAGVPGYRLAAIVDMFPNFLSAGQVVPVADGRSYLETLAELGAGHERFPYGLFERLPIARWVLAPTAAAADAGHARTDLRIEPGRLLPKGRYRAYFRVHLEPGLGRAACRIQLLRGSSVLQDHELDELGAGAGPVHHFLWFKLLGPDDSHAFRLRCAGARGAAIEAAHLDHVR